MSAIEENSENSSKKQGGYGKIPIHKDRLPFASASELLALLELKFFLQPLVKNDPNCTTFDYANDMLGKTSRSFTMVIRQLDEELRNCICIFYLVLRALDTVEDDTQNFQSNDVLKIQYLREFHTHLGDETWQLTGIGEHHEREVLENFNLISKAFNTLPPSYQQVIRDITKRMGDGMAEFVTKDMGQGTVNCKEYNLYCYYVAGLVGEGLSSLFTSSGKEGVFSNDLSHSMGLFLQKVNIIRDYLEDFHDQRAFWPAEIWNKYATNLGDFAQIQYQDKALLCLNEMIMDALQHIPDSLQYLNQLQDNRVFRFCAIPQLMAIATLVKLYNNPKVFTGVVKIRKGQAARLMQCQDLASLHASFMTSMHTLQNKTTAADVNFARINDMTRVVTHMTQSTITIGRYYSYTILLSPLALLTCFWYVCSREELLPRLSNISEVAVLALLITIVTLLFSFFGLNHAMRLFSAAKQIP